MTRRLRYALARLKGRLRRPVHRAAVGLGYLLALAGLVDFALAFGLRWGILAGAAALGILAFAIDGDLQ